MSQTSLEFQIKKQHSPQKAPQVADLGLKLADHSHHVKQDWRIAKGAMHYKRRPTLSVPFDELPEYIPVCVQALQKAGFRFLRVCEERAASEPATHAAVHIEIST